MTRSASLPAWILPTLSETPRTSAALRVIERRAARGREAEPGCEAGVLSEEARCGSGPCAGRKRHGHSGFHQRRRSGGVLMIGLQTGRTGSEDGTPDDRNMPSGDLRSDGTGLGRGFEDELQFELIGEGEGMQDIVGAMRLDPNRNLTSECGQHDLLRRNRARFDRLTGGIGASGTSALSAPSESLASLTAAAALPSTLGRTLGSSGVSSEPLSSVEALSGAARSLRWEAACWRRPSGVSHRDQDPAHSGRTAGRTGGVAIKAERSAS